MLGRRVTNTLLQLPINARRVLSRRPAFQCQSQHDLLSRAIIFSSIRAYATPGRPRKAVGEPSRPVKRAVKRDAKSSDGGEAKARNQARKATARGKKGGAAKKKKAAPKKRVKKELTPEQKEAKKAKTAQAHIRDLKKTALDPPADGARFNAHTVFIQEKLKGQKVGGAAGLPDALRQVNREWKELTPADLEHYNHQAQQRKQAAQAEYKRWVESHTAEQIKAANNARKELKRKVPNLKAGKYAKIHDERAVKQPLSAYLQFSINRHASGDFRNIPVGERAKLLSQEWRSLNESEKKKYKDLESEDRSRYSSEYLDVFGHRPPAQQAAAAGA